MTVWIDVELSGDAPGDPVLLLGMGNEEEDLCAGETCRKVFAFQGGQLFQGLRGW